VAAVAAVAVVVVVVVLYAQNELHTVTCEETVFFGCIFVYCPNKVR
jgi:hypothetical protein